ncbi:hypothetical protein GCM10027589_00600 [Actinocorallia lasiicapitis]
MYDAWWDHLGAWGLADLKKVRRQAISYYCTPVSTLVEKAELIRFEPLSEEESTLHRPDLPFAAVRDVQQPWPSAPPTDPREVADVLTAQDREAESLLTAPEIYLVPFGPSGGRKTPVLVAAPDGVAFTRVELLFEAMNIQGTRGGASAETEGMGIFRSGLHRGRPSYYLWGARSRLEETISQWADRG